MLTASQFKQLQSIQQPNCISFYLPTHRVGGVQKDQILYKNTLAKIEKELSTTSLSPIQIEERLADAQKKLAAEDFWQYLSDTLVVFITEQETQFFALPLALETIVYIGPKLYLKPIVPFMNEKESFYVLALSQNEVRVFEGTAYTLAELEKNEAFPENLAEILETYDPGATLQTHSGKEGNPLFHGQGGGKDVENVRIDEYLRKVDESIMQMVCDNDKKPLILYTTPTLVGNYRKINSYPHLMEGFVEGNPENVDMALIHEKAWSLQLPTIVKEEQERLDKFRENMANEKASVRIEEIIPAAFAGRIAALYLAKNTEIWGHYDATKHQVNLHGERQAASQPMLNDAALAVLAQGGEVFQLAAENMPVKHTSVNAVFRYVMQESDA